MIPSRFVPHSLEELNEAREAFKYLKGKLITVDITYLCTDLDRIHVWLKTQTKGFWLTQGEYEALDLAPVPKDNSEPTMNEIIESIRRIIQEDDLYKLKIHFVDRGDAIKFKLIWHKQ